MCAARSIADDRGAVVAARHAGAESIATAVIRLPLPTPTLPPATTTNHILLGGEHAVVVDPASPDKEAQARLIALISDLQRDAGWHFEGLLLTHHHRDHVGAASALAGRLALPVIAHSQTASRLADRIVVDRLIGDGDIVAGQWRVLHTPGHAPGHVVLHDREGAGMIAGDMVAAEGTIIVDPADGGSMAQYLASLRRLAALAPTWLVPAHGGVIREPAAVLDFYIRHRLEREARVLDALDRRWRAPLRLLPTVYGDVPRLVWPIALRSLDAHLIHLAEQGLIERRRDTWRRLA